MYNFIKLTKVNNTDYRDVYVNVNLMISFSDNTVEFESEIIHVKETADEIKNLIYNKE